jgi:hypothetical protein
MVISLSAKENSRCFYARCDGLTLFEPTGNWWVPSNNAVTPEGIRDVAMKSAESSYCQLWNVGMAIYTVELSPWVSITALERQLPRITET